MALFGKKKGVVGLDIGSNAVKACELTPLKGGGWEVENLGMVPLAPEAIVDGTILDSAVVIDAITELFQDTRIKTKDVATSVSGNSVIIKKITLPAMSEEELGESIQWEAEQYIPFDIEDVNIDYQILSEGPENMDVLLVAVKKDKINDYTQVISQAGLNPVIVDVDAFAMQNAFESNFDQGADEVVALVNVGASIININILKDGSSVFWRDIASGGNKFTEEIQRELHIAQEQAEELKRGVNVEGVPTANAQPVIEQVTNEIATEIQKTFDFFMATSSTERINRIVLAGGTSNVKGLETTLGEKFGATVEVLNPFEQIEITGRNVDEDAAIEDACQYSVAVGLAARRADDAHINLLRSEGRSPGAKTSAVAAPREGLQPMHIGFILIVAVALGYVGWDFYRLSTEIKRLEGEKATLEQEKKRLEPILAEKAELEKKREALDRKIKIIRELKGQQRGPVMLFDELSKNLPEYVWLQSMQESNFQLQLAGFALNANKVADFVENLDRSGLFVVGAPNYTRVKSSDGRDQVSFRLTAEFKLPEVEGEAGADEAASTTAQAGSE